MDKLDKFLAKLDRRRKERMFCTMDLISDGKLDTLNIKALEGVRGHFRCRVGDMRILFLRRDGKNHIYSAGFRGDMYK